jgi:serine phosphatase RsbU (regulator of sigma subunit)
MLSSIRAAQKIQQTIIPTEEQLRDALPDSFLFYKPMDIVSGDLPFVRREGERLFIATIDCTGHGVPAAMLSFMAYYNLNDIIGRHKELEVSGILSMLHQRILSTVHGQSMNGTLGDGMDITLVELDLERRVLWYSGAQSSLLFVRDGDCQRIQGDKCSIGDPLGGSAAGFRTHRIDLRPTDHVYLYSDGLVHQFGGPNGRKKLSNARLMKTVSALAEHSALEAGTHLATIYHDWQETQAQTDDIVLIGFSIGRQASVMAA